MLLFGKPPPFAPWADDTALDLGQLSSGAPTVRSIVMPLYRRPSDKGR